MSTHNIGFYEDFAKNYLSIIIKYIFYLFFCNSCILSWNYSAGEISENSRDYVPYLQLLIMIQNR